VELLEVVLMNFALVKQLYWSEIDHNYEVIFLVCKLAQLVKMSFCVETQVCKAKNDLQFKNNLPNLNTCTWVDIVILVV
jgi:hypothetical protein